MKTSSSYIRAIESFVPDNIIDNSLFEKRFGLKPDEILRRTGLRGRRYALNESTPTEMGIIAAEEAISSAGLSKTDIDMIISASTSRDQSIPPDSMIYAHKLRIPGVQCLHTEVVCLSFLNALEIADLYIKGGIHKNILIISSEMTSRVIDQDDPKSSFLLGDGAAAAILSSSQDCKGLRASLFRTEALDKNINVASIEGGGLKNLPADSHYLEKMATFHVNGPLELRLAIKFLPGFLKELLIKADCSLEDIKLVIPHQVVPKMMKSILPHIGLTREKLLINTDYGNMAAASIPVLLAEAAREGTVRRGDTILLLGGAAGFSLGGIVLEY